MSSYYRSSRLAGLVEWMGIFGGIWHQTVLFFYLLFQFYQLITVGPKQLGEFIFVEHSRIYWIRSFPLKNRQVYTIFCFCVQEIFKLRFLCFLRIYSKKILSFNSTQHSMVGINFLFRYLNLFVSISTCFLENRILFRECFSLSFFRHSFTKMSFHINKSK